MSLEKLLLEKFKQLSTNKQEELLDFAEFLSQKSFSKPQLKSIRGICKDLRTNITQNQIQEIRQEMWQGFPREESFS